MHFAYAAESFARKPKRGQQRVYHRVFFLSFRVRYTTPPGARTSGPDQIANRNCYAPAAGQKALGKKNKNKKRKRNAIERTVFFLFPFKVRAPARPSGQMLYTRRVLLLGRADRRAAIWSGRRKQTTITTQFFVKNKENENSRSGDSCEILIYNILFPPPHSYRTF